jgi:hypothetical protein
LVGGEKKTQRPCNAQAGSTVNPPKADIHGCTISTPKPMKLSKALLGAILVGVTAQATGCTKGEEPKPKQEQKKKGESGTKTPDYCPGCGMG